MTASNPAYIPRLFYFKKKCPRWGEIRMIWKIIQCSKLAHWKIILIIWLKVTGCTRVRFWQFSYTHGHKNWIFHKKKTKKVRANASTSIKSRLLPLNGLRSCSWGFHISGKGNFRICSPRTIALVVWIPLGEKWVWWVIKGENSLLRELWSTVYKMLWIAFRT